MLGGEWHWGVPLGSHERWCQCMAVATWWAPTYVLCPDELVINSRSLIIVGLFHLFTGRTQPTNIGKIINCLIYHGHPSTSHK